MRTLLLLPVVVTGFLSVTLSDWTNAVEGNESEHRRLLAVQRAGERFVARLYTRAETRTHTVHNRMVTTAGTLYWLEIRWLDSRRTYTVWERWYGIESADLPEGRPREFWLTIGDGENVALTYFDGHAPILFEVDASSELKPEGDPRSINRKPGVPAELSALYIPLGRVMQQEYGNRGLVALLENRHSIDSIVWQDDAWHVTFEASDRKWLFVRPKGSKEWQFKPKEQEDATP